MSETTMTQKLESCLARLRAGDSQARDDLWGLVNDRLTVLTRRMLHRDYSRVRHWEQTEDVAQNVRLRLMRALQDIIPATAREFYGLASLQIRRELIDRIRQLTGRAGDREPPRSFPDGTDAPGDGPEDSGSGPEDLAVWEEFHQAVEELPEQEREVFDLHWYQELSLEEAAEVLGVDRSTARRRWRGARLKLAAVLPQDQGPEG
jgi:RNA polymerase sigma-70 factor (ECF subfamily)